MNGIILAGGTGSRLRPTTYAVGKHLHPVYDKPLIYYPFETLIRAGIDNILIITTPKDFERTQKVVGNHTYWRNDPKTHPLTVQYAAQASPKGIADAFNIGRLYFDGNVTLILGDNVFWGNYDIKRDIDNFKGGAQIYGYKMPDVRKFGVVEMDRDGKVLSLEEKPAHPRSNMMVPGLYIYDHKVYDIAKNLKPSERGEVEITDVSTEYLKRGELRAKELNHNFGMAWFDCGNHDDLLEAANFIREHPWKW